MIEKKCPISPSFSESAIESTAAGVRFETMGVSQNPVSDPILRQTTRNSAKRQNEPTGKDISEASGSTTPKSLSCGICPIYVNAQLLRSSGSSRMSSNDWGAP